MQEVIQNGSGMNLQWLIVGILCLKGKLHTLCINAFNYVKTGISKQPPI